MESVDPEIKSKQASKSLLTDISSGVELQRWRVRKTKIFGKESAWVLKGKLIKKKFSFLQKLAMTLENKEV